MLLLSFGARDVLATDAVPISNSACASVVDVFCGRCYWRGRRVSSRVRLESWEFPGWGSHFTMISPPGLAMSNQDKDSG